MAGQSEVRKQDFQDEQNVERGIQIKLREQEEGIEEEENEEEEVEEEEEENTARLFEQLFKSYQKISAQLEKEDGMEGVLQEYDKLFSLAKEWRQNGDELQERVDCLERDMQTLRAKFDSCCQHSSKQRREIENLKKEKEFVKHLADAAHTREQNTVEMALGLRNKLAALTKDVSPKKGVAADQIERMPMLRSSEFNAEKEKMAAELDVVKQRLERAMEHARQSEKVSAEQQERIDELNENLETQIAAKNTENSLKKRYSSELAVTRDELKQSMQVIATLQEQYSKSLRECRRLEKNLRTSKIRAERLLRHNKVLSTHNYNLQNDKDLLEGTLETMSFDRKQRARELKVLEEDMLRQNKETKRAGQLRETALRKADAAMAARWESEKEVRHLKTRVLDGLQKDLRDAHKETREEGVAAERFARENQKLNKALKRCHDEGDQQALMLMLKNKRQQALTEELDWRIECDKKNYKTMQSLKLTRDRLLMQTTDLEMQVHEALENMRMKQVSLYEGNRRLEESRAQYRHQRNLYEAMRDERNTLTRDLKHAQEEILEVKRKLVMQSHHVVQMKDDVALKDEELRQAARVMAAVEKERAKLRVLIEAAKTELFPDRTRVFAAIAAIEREGRLVTVIGNLEAEMRKKEGETERAKTELDVMASQLVRRNDEVTFLYQKIQLQEMALLKGDAEYGKRLDDIRLLKLEVLRLRKEKTQLQRTLDNNAKLRDEMFQLQRDLTQARTRVSVLEEELLNPLNLHRWRKLQGTDPTTFDLIQKVQLLQKRLLAQATVALEREQNLREAQQLYAGLRSLLERRATPDVTVTLHRTKMALRQRGQKMKVLSAEATLYEAQITEFKSALQKEKDSVADLKRQNLELQLRERKLKEKVKAAKTGATKATAAQRSEFLPRCGFAFAPATAPAAGASRLWTGGPGPRSRIVTAAARLRRGV